MAFTLAQIFCIGLLLGWIRWASGSTLLTIGLHMLANLAACIQAADQGRVDELIS